MTVHHTFETGCMMSPAFFNEIHESDWTSYELAAENNAEPDKD